MRKISYTLFLLLSSTLSWAVTINITTTTDENDGGAGGTGISIRDAISMASAGDLIDIPAGTYLLTLGELSVNTNNLTFSGVGATATFIDGNNTSRMFNVSATNCTFQNVRLQNGQSPANVGGGALRFTGTGTITITSCVFHSNNASGNTFTANGGGLLVLGTNSTTIIDDCAFINNRAGNNGGVTGNGGAVWFDNPNPTLTATVTKTTFLDNSAGDRSGAIGTNIIGSLSLTNCTLTGNSARRDGGALGIDRTTVITLKNCTFSNNSTSVGSQGGGFNIRPGGSSYSMFNVIAYGNTAGGVPHDILANGTLTGGDRNLVGVCTGANCGAGTAIDYTTDPNLTLVSTCGLQSFYAPQCPSDAIDNGTTLGGTPTTDICGTTWGVIDIGAIGVEANAEIDVQGSATSIIDGDITPDVADDTDFGSISASTPHLHTFTIDNTGGTAPLSVGSIDVTGTNASEFVIGGITFPLTVGAGSSSSFTLTFTPTALGTRTASLAIFNNDCSENPYNFDVEGNGTPVPAPTPVTTNNFAGPILNPFSLTDPYDRLAPTFGDLDNDGDLDMLWGEEYARLGYFENIGTNTAPNYAPSQTLPFGLTDQGNESRPRFVDLDNDGDLDLMIAVNTGLTYFENIGTPSTPNFGVAQTNPFGLANLGVYYSTPTFGDLDNDGDLDLIVGSSNGNFTYIENIGTVTAPSFDFAGRTPNPYGLTSIGNAGNWSSPYLVDWDNDGDMDLMASEVGTVINYFENTGTSSAPNFATVQQNPFCLAPIGGLTGIETADLDFDGDQDIIIGSDVGFHFFEGNVFAEIDVQGNTNSISNGDNTPSSTDHTAFGDAVFCLNQTIVRTFTIDNIAGNIDLNVTNVISSDPDFVVSNITTPLVLIPGSSTTFDVTFTPLSLGISNASITISNYDCDEAPYVFGIQGNGTAPATDIIRDQALDFDGIDDYVDCGNAPELDARNIQSMEAWVKFDAFTGEQEILSKSSNCQGSELLISNGGATLSWYLMQTGCAAYSYLDYLTSNLNTGEWYHIACAWDGNTKESMRLYINGISVGTRSDINDINVSGISNPSNGFHIGQWGNFGRSFNGQIDEVRLWSNTRTENDIRENMHLSLSGCEANLLAYYQMNDGTGSSSLSDQSGNGNNGTLTNMNTASDWVASGVNVGQDASSNSNSQTIAAVAAGTSIQNFTAAHLQMRFFAHSEIENYTVTYQEFTPNVITGANGINIIQNPMWTVNKSSNTATQLVDYEFTFPAVTFTNLDPRKYSLYWRAMNAEGNWTKVATAHSVTSTSIGFGKISLTGQFMVIQESDDFISDVRGNMYALDGINDNIVTPLNLDDAVVPITTWEAWVKPTNLSNSNWQMIMGIEDTGWDRFLAIQGGLFQMGVGSGPFSPVAAIPNEWQHVAVVYNQNNITFYLNGVAYPCLGCVNTGHSSVQTFHIGSSIQAGPTQFFGGAVDEIRVWNLERTQNEIRENMHLTLKGNETGLLAYYQFNNDDAVTTAGGVKDATGINDATAQNMTSTAYLPSEVAVAGGTSDRITIGGAGLVNFPNTGVDIEFGAITPNGEIVVYRLETEKPHGWESISGDVDNEYFVVENFGTNSSFDPLVDLTFNRLSYISPTDVGLPQASSPLQLYKRGDNDFGATWGSSWGGADNASPGTNGAVSYNTTNGLNSFSQLVIANAALNSDLPVELMRFDAKRSDRDQVRLNWSTASELNNEGFFIERMLEEESEFKSIGFVEGLGTTTSISNYQFMDENSYPDISYYRLKQVDFDGTATYSAIKAVDGDASITDDNTKYIDVSIYPNPVYNELKVRFNKLPKKVKTANVQILSINGQVLHHFSAGLQSYQVLEIEYVSQLTPALYLLSIELDNGEKILQKFIKK